MLHPDSLADVARLRHEDDLRQAEAERLYKQLKGNQPDLLQQVNNLLDVARRWLEAQAEAPTQAAGRSITDQFKQVR